MKMRYFDAGSFTPLHKKSYAAIREVLRRQVRGEVGNPLSAHAHGRESDAYVKRSREIIARAYQMRGSDVVFTSGATEANLIAVRTALLHALRNGRSLSDMHAVIGFDEHSSVFKAAAYAKELGVDVTVARPSRGRKLAPEDVAKEVRENTIFLSVQLVNSLHGLVQPIARIADACRAVQPSVFVHTDSAQGTAYHNCSPHALRVDAATIDGTKTFGPQGVGALLFRKAQRYAGLQGERSLFDLRPGTPSVALLYGFAAAVQEMSRLRPRLAERVSSRRRYLAELLTGLCPDTVARGLEKRLQDVRDVEWEKLAPHLLYISFPDTNHAYLATLLDTDGFSLSTGSACSTQGEEAIRAGLLPTTTERDIRALVRCLDRRLPLARAQR